eukprot:1188914-Prorocentrum_minimum.AAC.2
MVCRFRYGLGTKRSLRQWQEWVGVNYENKTISDKRCGQLQWVPYDTSDMTGGCGSIPSSLESPRSLPSPFVSRAKVAAVSGLGASWGLCAPLPVPAQEGP